MRFLQVVRGPEGREPFVAATGRRERAVALLVGTRARGDFVAEAEFGGSAPAAAADACSAEDSSVGTPAMIADTAYQRVAPVPGT